MLFLRLRPLSCNFYFNLKITNRNGRTRSRLAAVTQPRAPGRRSCTLHPQFRYAEEVEGRTTKNEQPIHFGQSA